VKFFYELKRGNVYKVAVAYAVVSWLVVQVAATVVPAPHLSDAITSAVVLLGLVCLGFPIALVLAWAFEITPEGIKREEDVAPNESITHRTGQKLLGITIALAVLAAGSFAYRASPPPAPAVSSSSASTAAALPTSTPEKSIAVLPSENLSDDKANAYFASGMQDMILTKWAPDAALAAIPHSPGWLMTRWEHSVAPIGVLRGQALPMKGETARAGDAFIDAERQLKQLLTNPSQIADANGYLGLVNAGVAVKDLALKAAGTAVEMLPIARDVVVEVFCLDRLARTETRVGATRSAIDHLGQLMFPTGGEAISIATLRIDPAWDPLREDPRFQALLTRYGAGEGGTK
jgi:hypothetical protein